MKNKVEFHTCCDDTKVDSVWIELESHININEMLQILTDFQKRYTNENCIYSSTIRNFKPTLAIFHIFQFGWESGCKIRFFDKSMLDNAQIESGFSDEPKNDETVYNRTVYNLEQGNKSKTSYKLKTLS